MRQTVVGVFDGFEAARHAAELLRQRGIDDDDIHVTAADDDAAADGASARHDGHDKGLLQRIKDFFSGAADDDDVGLYSEHVRRGGAVVAVDVDGEPRVDTAREALEQAGAIDIDDRAALWRAGGWSHDAGASGDDRRRWPDGLSGGGDTDGHRTGLGVRPGVGGGADVPMPGSIAGGDPGYAADPDDLITRGRGEESLSVEFPGGTGESHRVSYADGSREGRPLEDRAITVPDTEVRHGLTSSVTPGAAEQSDSAAAADLARRSTLLSQASQDDDGGAVRPTSGGLSTGGQDDRDLHDDAGLRGDGVAPDQSPTSPSSASSPSSLADTGMGRGDSRRVAALEGGRTTGADPGVGSGPASGGRALHAGEEVLPVVREDLQVGKRAVKAGGVRVYTRLVEDRVHESVDLREEHARVERRPVDRPATAADLSGLGERSIEIEETVEQPVVHKTARVVEEVVVGKEVGSRRAEIDETLRHTEVDVQPLAGSDVSATARGASAFDGSLFRSDFDSRYGASGARWEEYEPAYRYGHGLAADDRYRGRDWDAVEADARTDWERRHGSASADGSSTWERMKGAVRSAWERAKT